MLVTQSEKAKKFQELHHGNEPLILANAWDAASARIFEKAGFAAIGTTSAGIAASRGYADGQNIPLAEMLKCLEQIVEAVNIPVTADIEAGFGQGIEEILNTVRQVSSIGAVGINIEDSSNNKTAPLVDITAQTEKIRAIREEVEDNLWINARVDVFYSQLYSAQEALQETILCTRQKNDLRKETR